jgi:hypothetical protein
MKATITNCLAQLVESKFGKDRWNAILKDSGLEQHAGMFRISPADVPDDHVVKLIGSTCKVLGISAQQAADAFGEYWCCTYAPKLYAPIVKRFKNAKEMILGMDNVHIDMTETIPNARPPRFEYVWEDKKTLVVDYKSTRNMIDIYIGLVKGVGTLFKEKLAVTKISPHRVEIVFG